MKKNVLMLVCLIIMFCVGGKIVFAQGNYQNPNDILISYPEDHFITHSENISILGCCDYDYDLYMDDQKLDKTRHGFFCAYPKLNYGTNHFLFTNGENTKHLVIIRDENSRPPIPDQNIIFFDSPKHAIVKYDNISHRSRPDEANDDLLEPLVKDTALKVLGQTEEYYFVSDKTFVYKYAVDLFDGPLAENKIRTANIANNELKLDMDVNSLYKVDYRDDNIILTLYDTSLDLENESLFYGDGDVIKNVEIRQSKDLKDLDVIECKLNLKDNIKTNGYYVKQASDGLVFGLNVLPGLSSQNNLEGITVLVDAGHGGHDNGTWGPTCLSYYSEKDINLSIALKLKDYLEDLGAQVIMTRDDDYFVTLGDRVKTIKDEKPDFSISIHGNSRVITRDFSKASGLIVYHTFDINNAPEIIKNSLARNLDFVRGTSVSNLALTRITNCPAVLIETAFLSYPDDYEWLIDDDNQETMAKSIAESVNDFFSHVCNIKN